MNMVIPPLFFYVLGAMLVIFGGARALWLGLRRPDREIAPEPDAAAQGAAATAKVRRRHLIFGFVWVLMGVFLIVSTAGVLRFRFPS